MAQLKRIILHVGMQKTGSTGIQETLFHNSSVLRSHGYIYLSEWGINHNAILFDIFSPTFDPNHRRIVLDGFTQEKWEETRKSNIKTMLDLIERNACETLILSSEELSLLDFTSLKYMKQLLTDLFPEAHMSCIFYTRSPISFLASEFQQMAASPYSEFRTDRDTQEYAKHVFKLRLGGFLELFHDDISIIRFEDAIRDEDGLVGNFLKLIDYPQQKISEIKVFRSNESRGAEAIEFLLYVKENMPFYLEENGRRIINPQRADYDNNAINTIPGPRFDFSYEQKMELFELTKHDSLWLKEQTGIDYTHDYPLKTEPVLLYKEKTLEEFLFAFKYLTRPMQSLFLRFFEKKYQELSDERFLALFSQGSEPWKIYHFGDIEPYLSDASISSKRVHNWGLKRPMWRDRVLITVTNANSGNPLPEHIFKYPLPNKGYLAISETFESQNDLYEIQIRPSMYSCITTILSLKVNGNGNLFQINQSTFDDKNESTYFFFKDNPHFKISSEKAITSFEIELVVDTGGFVYSRLNTAWIGKKIAAYEHELAKLKNENSKETKILCETQKISSSSDDHEIKHTKSYLELQSSYGALEAEQAKMLNSISWRITKPLRKLIALFTASSQ